MTAQEIIAKLDWEDISAKVMKNGLIFASYNNEGRHMPQYVKESDVMLALDWDQSVTAWDTTWGVCIMSLEE